MGGLFSKSEAPAGRAPFDPAKDLVNMKDKVVIVTGGKGIGLATVRYLLQAKAKVYMAARDESRATGAIAQLESEGLGRKGGDQGEVVWLKLDLSDPRDAKKSAEDFLKRETRLDVLVNNAGMMTGSGVGSDGISSMHIINYLSPYVFTRTLLPLLEKTAQEPDSDVRIVNVASRVHSMVPAGVQYRSIQDFNVTYKYRPLPNLLRYGNSKLALVLWSRHLQRQLSSQSPPSPITVIALHPGAVDTYSHTLPFPRVVKAVLSLLMVQSDVGALNSLFAAASKTVREEREKFAGSYLMEKPVGNWQEPSALARDDKLGDELVETTENFLKGIGL